MSRLRNDETSDDQIPGENRANHSRNAWIDRKPPLPTGGRGTRKGRGNSRRGGGKTCSARKENGEAIADRETAKRRLVVTTKIVPEGEETSGRRDRLPREKKDKKKRA